MVEAGNGTCPTGDQNNDAIPVASSRSCTLGQASNPGAAWSTNRYALAFGSLDARTWPRSD